MTCITYTNCATINYKYLAILLLLDQQLRVQFVPTVMHGNDENVADSF